MIRDVVISIDLEPEIERRLPELAKRSGKTVPGFARELIEDDVGDFDTAEMSSGRPTRLPRR